MSDWWDGLNDTWKNLFAINYVYQYRCSDSMREDLITLGTNPFEGYKMKTGEDFERFEVNDEMIEKIFNLEFLYASNCNLDDVLPLADFMNIRILDLVVNDIKDLSCISEFENLREVYIEKNSVESLDFLEKSGNLEVLFARYNLLREIGVLANLKHLTFLDVSANGISEQLSCLKDATQLIELQCGYNQVADLNFLAGHPSLEILDCTKNNIEDASFLFGIPKLKYVDISDNPVEYNKYDWNKLTDRGVEVDK